MGVTDDRTSFPDLATERLVLRGLCLDDTEFIFAHFSDPAVVQYLMDEPPLTDRTQAADLIRFYLEPEGKDHNRWGLVRRDSGQLVGTCGYHRWDRRNRRAEIGYDLTPGCRGQGFMAEAVQAALRHGFARMGLNKVDAVVYVGNEPSRRLLQRLGFRQEGLLRDHYLVEGRFFDHALHSLLGREWRPCAERG
jgi:ribosomal-protein-alanine N-acetyltransferase